MKKYKCNWKDRAAETILKNLKGFAEKSVAAEEDDTEVGDIADMRHSKSKTHICVDSFARSDSGEHSSNG